MREGATTLGSLGAGDRSGRSDLPADTLRHEREDNAHALLAEQPHHDGDRNPGHVAIGETVILLMLSPRRY